MTSRADSYPFAIHEAQRYLRAGDKTSARFWAQEAANLGPDQEDPWLILAAVSSPRASLEYLNHALEINPDSTRARQGMHWAIHRYRTSQTHQGIPLPTAPVAISVSAQKATVRQQVTWRPILIGFMIFLLGMILWMGYPILNSTLKTSRPLAVRQFITKASRTPLPLPADLEQSEALKLIIPTSSMITPGPPTPPFIPTATDAQTQTPSIQPTAKGEVAEIPLTDQPEQTEGSEADIPTSASPNGTNESTEMYSYDTPVVQTDLATEPLPGDTTEAQPTITPEAPITDTPEPEAEAPEPTEKPKKASKKQAKNPTQPNGQGEFPSVGTNEHWIDVDLSQQRVYAYQGDQIVNIFVVSTGTAYTPTVMGRYRIYVKYRLADMSGPGYYLPDVPYIMYFYKGYGLHGTYWHHNFGVPMSHGCVNLKTPEAQWLFEWASVGTLVNVHN